MNGEWEVRRDHFTLYPPSTLLDSEQEIRRRIGGRTLRACTCFNPRALINTGRYCHKSARPDKVAMKRKMSE